MAKQEVSKFTAAAKAAAKSVYADVIAGEKSLVGVVIDGTFEWKVKGGRAYFTAARSVFPQGDNLKPGELGDTEFAQINSALGVDKDHPFADIRPVATLSEDYACFRAFEKSSKALDIAKAAYRKANKGKDKPEFTTLRDLMPYIRTQWNGKEVGSSGRTLSDADKRAAAKIAADNETAFMFGYALGEFETDTFKATAAQRRLLDRLMIGGTVDINKLAATPKGDIDMVEQMVLGIFAQIRATGPRELPEDSDIPAPVKSGRKGKAAA